MLSVGYDLVEYAPAQWNPDGRKRIVHIDTQPAEVDAGYQPEVELIGDIEGTLRRLLAAVVPHGVGGRDAAQRHESKEILVNADLRTALLADLAAAETEDGFPISPGRAIADLLGVFEGTPEAYATASFPSWMSDAGRQARLRTRRRWRSPARP